MNIFYLSNDPAECAQYHCDRHVVKMIIEYCQLLSLAIWVNDPNQAAKLHEDKCIYNAPNLKGRHAHINHPSAIWVRSSRSHFDWLYKMTEELGREYQFRYGYKSDKQHLSITKCHAHLKSNEHFPERGWIDPPQCMPDECKDPDAITAYRKYYQDEKISFVSYTRRPPPFWLRM